MIHRLKKLEIGTIFLVVSLLIHFSAWLSLLIVHDKPRVEREIVEINYAAKPPPPPPRSPPPPKLTKQVVEQKDRINDEKDDAAKYLSAFDQKVEKQTKADNIAKFNNKISGGNPAQGKKSEKQTKKDTKTVEQEKGELPTLRDLSPQFAPTPGTSPQQAAEPGTAPATDDHLKDVQKGIQTLLSTREFVYYSYYSRIKQQISQYWEPNVREKVKIVYRQGRSIASAHDRVTQLLIVLDAQGNLIRVDVLSASGVHDLDDAAVEAFRSAAPFPNPPKGMVESDGTIKIRWDFILES
jgi:TonB family protein